MAATVRGGVAVCRTFCKPRFHLLKTNTLGCLQVPSRTLFGKKKNDKSQSADESEKRSFEKDFDGLKAVDTIQTLKKRTSIQTVKGYKPPANVESELHAIAGEVYGKLEDWKNHILTDKTLRFKFLTKAIQLFDHDIPSRDLHDMRTMDNVIQFYKAEVRDTCVYEDLNKLDLPKNLHMNLEPIRFDPETDSLFGGKSAFPGSKTVISSLKYRRKYTAVEE